jgi:carbonic anhydrase
MSLITRRKFAALAGLTAVSKVLERSGSGQHKTSEPPALQGKPAAKPAGKEPAKTIAAKVDRSTASPEEIWNDLTEGNRRFASGKTAPRDVIAARVKTAGGQHPFVIVLCCSDSRLSPEIIFDQNIGDLFVVRTAGNVADPIALASLEYAVEHLGSRMLVVLGHEKCGAVSATLSGEKMPTDNLTSLVEKIKPGVQRLKGLVTGDTLIALAVEANVHHSAADVIENSPIIRHEVASGALTVVKATYSLATGEVRRISNIKSEI